MTDATFDAAKFTEQSRLAWSETAAHYDRMSSDLFFQFTPFFAKFAELSPGKKVLDIACGPGLASFEAAARVGASGKVLGVDLAPGMIKIASEKAKAKGLANLEFREMNAEHLDFPDASFDVVMCQLGLMLFADPGKALKEMARVVRKGGCVACLVQGDPEKMLMTSLVNKLVYRLAPQLKVAGAPGLYAFAPAGILEKAFQEAGLDQVSSWRRGGLAVFDSPEAYWDMLTASSGRLKTALGGLPAELRDSIRAQLLEAARPYIKEGRLELTIEVAMAKGFKP